jgi:hypothetical protein
MYYFLDPTHVLEFIPLPVSRYPILSVRGWIARDERPLYTNQKKFFGY